MMNVLYAGGYKERFNYVIEQIKDLPLNSQILELCFGDTYIAEYCKRRGFKWSGIDLNQKFVNKAKKLGYNASCEDLTTDLSLPKADVCIMMGSLYHFYPQAFSILKRMTNAATIVIISEPVINLSKKRGLIGFLARRAANVGKGNEAFRFDSNSLMMLIHEVSGSLNYSVVKCLPLGKDLIIKLIKNASN